MQWTTVQVLQGLMKTVAAWQAASVPSHRHTPVCALATAMTYILLPFLLSHVHLLSLLYCFFFFSTSHCFYLFSFFPLSRFTLLILVIFIGRNSLVGKATHYGLNGPGIKSRWRPHFPHPSRPALGPNQHPIKWVSCLFPGDKAAGAWL